MHDDIINRRYQVKRKLGQGGMGMVYLVEDTHREDLPMALKTMISKDIDEGFLDAFRREFAELAKLRHPNVAAAYDFGRISGTHEHFFTTEFVDGTDLYKGTKRESFDQLLDITIQLLRGLDFIHKHGLLHNDLKPANILLAPITQEAGSRGRGDMTKLETAVFGLAGQVKLIDFGLLSGLNIAWDKIRGTSRYLCPERIRCMPADARADLYSLGCVLYLLAARRYAFNEVDTRKILKLHLEATPARLDTICYTVPAAYAEFIHRLLEKKPDDRFAGADEALHFLGESLGLGSGLSAVKNKTPKVEAGSLLNRESELATLGEFFERALSGTSSSPCVVIEGKSGIGKTRLVEELKSTVQIRDGAFIALDGAAVQGHLQPILDGLLGGLRTSGAPILKEVEAFLAVRRKSETFAGELAACLEKIVFWCAEELPLLIHFDDFHSSSETIRLFVVGLVQTAFEKLNEATPDEDTKIPRLMVVLSRRPLSDRGTLQISGLHTMRLEPFSEEGSHLFLKRLFGQEDIPERILSGLSNAARGNPQFLLELARNLVDQGHINYSGARWVFPASLDRIPLPESIRSAMDDRIAALGSDGTNLLEWLSVSRAPISLDTLAHCTLLELERIAIVTRNLVEGGFLQCEHDKNRDRYYLSYPDLKESLVGKLDESRLQFMHQRLAQGIEKEHRGDGATGELAELLAAHWLPAGNLPAFLRFAPAAAARLQECGNLELAVDYHQRVAAALPDEAAAKRVKSLVKLSEMHEFLWDLQRSEEDLKTVLTLGEHLLKPRDRVALLRRLTSLAISRNDNAKALRLVQKAYHFAGKSIDPIVKLSLEAPEAWARWFRKDRDQARELIEHLETNLSACNPTGAREQAAFIGAQNYLANLYRQLGKLERSISLHRANLEMLEDMGSEQAVASCLCSLGGALLDVGLHREAEEFLNSALEKGKNIGDRRTLCRARERLGEYHFLHGDIKTALRMTQVGLQDAKNIRHLSATANSLRMLGRIYRRAGQLEDAQDVLSRAVALHRDTGDVVDTPLSRIFLAKLYLAQNSADLAREELEQARSLIEEYDLAFARSHYLLHMVEANLITTGSLYQHDVVVARKALEKVGCRREICDLELICCQGALRRSDAGTSRQILTLLEEPLAAVGSEEQKAEAAYLDALVDIAEDNLNSGAYKLTEVGRLAKNAVFPEIATRCRERLTELQERVS